MAKGLAISYWPESPLALTGMSPVQASGLNVAGLNVAGLNVTHPYGTSKVFSLINSEQQQKL
jgi:hypothetical protein